MLKTTGIGIPKDKQESIFNKFERLTSAYKGAYKGSGLGLYLVKEYVRILQGHIEVESEVGEGTKFCVSLPFEMAKLAKAVPLDIPKDHAPVRLNQTPCEVTELRPRQKIIGKALVVEDSLLPARAVIKAYGGWSY